MAQQINHVTIGGNLTKDPELRSTAGGTSLCKLRIANNRRSKNSSGEWYDKPGYYDVTVWGAQGENCAQYLSKGRGVMVSGELQWREWDATDGSGKRQAIEIVAREVQFLYDGNQSDTGSASFTPESDVPADTADLGVPAGAADDDIPF